jgi:hypothetical protein
MTENELTSQEHTLDFTPHELPVIYELSQDSESPELDLQPEIELTGSLEEEPNFVDPEFRGPSEINFIHLDIANHNTTNDPVVRLEQSPVIMDKTLKPIFDTVYTTLTTLAHGMNITPDNWILLLSKAMYLVAQLKELNKGEKIELSVELVIKYLDDNTAIPDNILMTIKSGVYSMCTSMLDNTGTLPNKPGSGLITNQVDDPDMIATPQQIMDLLLKKIITFIKLDGCDLSRFKQDIPEILFTLIAILDKFKHISSTEKKDLLITTFQKLIKDEAHGLFNLSAEQQTQLNTIVSSMPFVIDTLVNVARGKPAFTFSFDDLPRGTGANKFKRVLVWLLTCGCIKYGHV